MSCIMMTPSFFAGAAGPQQHKAKKNRSAKPEKGDKLDEMVANYKAKFFGASNKQGSKASGTPAATGISRWFE